MTKARDRSSRSGSDPIQIGSTKLVTDGSDNLSVTNTSGTPKKLIASEIEIGDSSNKVIIKKGSDNKVQFQTQASGGSATDSSAGGTKVYANISAMTAVSASAGDQAIVSANNSLYVNNGNGWYKVAVINTSPTISSPSNNADITLATDGTATSIEVVGADVDEGTTLQYSYAVTTGSLTNGGGASATVTSCATSGGTYTSLNASALTTNKFFKITPTTNSSYAGTFSITFSASDTINSATTVQNFTLVFATYGSIDCSGDNNSVIRAPYSTTNFAMGTGDFTIECWIKLDVVENQKGFFVIGGSDNPWGNNNGNIGTSLSLGYLSSDGLAFMSIGNSNWDTCVAAGGASPGFHPTAGQWHHYVITRTGTAYKIFADGVVRLSVTDSTDYAYGGCLIGTWYMASYTMNGLISDFRVVKGTGVYTSNFTPPTDALSAISGTTLLTCTTPSGSTVTDHSSNNMTMTLAGNCTTSSTHPY